jgi:hypothetical protein
MGEIIDFIFDPGGDAADAAEKAAETQAQWQNRALDYLQETEEVPQALRQEALTTLGGLYGLGGPGSQLAGTGGTGTGDIYAPAPAGGGGGTGTGDYEIQKYEGDPRHFGYMVNSGEGLTRPSNLIDRYKQVAYELDYLQNAWNNYSGKMRDQSAGHIKNSISVLQNELDELEKMQLGVIPLGEGITLGPPSGTQPTDSTGGAVDPVTGEPVTEEWDPYGQMDEFIERAKMSPLYQNIMGGQELGEEAIMRNAAATGGLRSGNVQGNMYDYITQLQNQALLSSYNEQLSGLQGMAGLPSNAGMIANQMGNIGQTYAQGQVAAANAQNQGVTNWLNTGLGIGGLIMASDIRLKKNIEKIGKVNGFNFYSFDWNSIANKLGLTGSTCGCMAHELYDVMPEAIVLRNDFMWINYSMIGVF